MEFEYRVDKDTGTSRSRYRLWYRSKVYHLAESVYKNKDSIVFVVVSAKFEDEVYRYRLPTLSEVVDL